MANPTDPITITISLRVVNRELTETVTYSGGVSGRARKIALQPTIRNEKRNRTKTFILPQGDHSEHLEHTSWITNDGDTVLWTCDQLFMLYVDYDLGVCDNLIDAPQHPFDDAFDGVQVAEKVTGGRFEIRGTTQMNESVNQMFYKYTAWVPGVPPLDPDGICSTGL
jgi:hypothetical protein